MLIPDMIEARPMFAVFIRRKNGSEFIAVAAGSVPALYYGRAAARRMRRQLRAHQLKAFIRPVTATIRPDN